MIVPDTCPLTLLVERSVTPPPPVGVAVGGRYRNDDGCATAAAVAVGGADGKGVGSRGCGSTAAETVGVGGGQE